MNTPVTRQIDDARLAAGGDPIPKFYRSTDAVAVMNNYPLEVDRSVLYFDLDGAKPPVGSADADHIVVHPAVHVRFT